MIHMLSSYLERIEWGCIDEHLDLTEDSALLAGRLFINKVPCQDFSSEFFIYYIVVILLYVVYYTVRLAAKLMGKVWIKNWYHTVPQAVQRRNIQQLWDLNHFKLFDFHTFLREQK